MAEKLPGRFRGKPEAIAQELTLMPIYLPFLRFDLGQELKKAMVQPNSDHRTIPSLHPLKVGQPETLRFCKNCWKEQERSHGERYWSRSHQVPGNVICPQHHTVLWQSPINWSYRQSWQHFVEASSVDLKDCSRLDVPRRSMQMLRDVADGVHWLLNDNRFGPGAELLRISYLEALEERGLAHGKFVRVQELKQLVRERVGKSTLDYLHSGFSETSESDWLSTLLRGSRVKRSSQPAIRHLLLVHALGHSVRSFFSAIQSLSPLEKALGGNDHIGAENSPRWDVLQTWWPDPLISVNEMARRMGVDPQTINLAAARMGLATPRFNKWGNAMERTGSISGDIRKHQREAFLRLRQANPETGLHGLRFIDRRLVTWLRRHDSRWLKDHRPMRIQSGGAPSLDWSARDSGCVTRLPSIIESLRHRGTKLSVNAIERELRLRIGTLRSKMPMTDRFLTDQVGLPRRHRLLPKASGKIF